jgi:hypothetical protein
MSEFASTVGFVVIVVLYASIGLMAVLGSIVITQKLFAPRHEQVFYGLFLVAIAAFFLAFAAYFGAGSSWATESTAVVFFAVLGLAGTRLPSALIVGYPLHALWDMLHEWHAHAGAVMIAPEQLTSIPLAYGVFCLTYDVGVALYVRSRKTTWIQDWKTRRSGP